MANCGEKVGLRARKGSAAVIFTEMVDVAVATLKKGQRGGQIPEKKGKDCLATPLEAQNGNFCRKNINFV